MIQSYYVCYSDEATDDLRNIFLHIAVNLQSRDNAERQVNRIREAIRNLENYPQNSSTGSLRTMGKPWNEATKR